MAAPLVLKQAYTVVDDRTTVVCLDAAGQIRPVDEPFETLAGEFEAPPFHIHCRTTVLPWLPGFVSGQRSAANAELRRRPVKQRQKGPGGVGARIPPAAEPATPTADRVPQLGELQELMLQPETKRQARVRLRAEYDAGLVDGEDQFTAAERQAIQVYGGPGYKLLNAALRVGVDSALDAEVRGLTLRELKRLLDSAMAKTRLHRPQVVLRALSGQVANGAQVGDVLHDDAYLSTSTSPTVAIGFVENTGDRVLVLELPTGHPALRPNRDEMELLLPGMTLRVVAVDERFVRVVPV